jgi:hypothetical protein
VWGGGLKSVAVGLPLAVTTFLRFLVPALFGWSGLANTSHVPGERERHDWCRFDLGRSAKQSKGHRRRHAPAFVLPRWRGQCPHLRLVYTGVGSVASSVRVGPRFLATRSENAKPTERLTPRHHSRTSGCGVPDGTVGEAACHQDGVAHRVRRCCLSAFGRRAPTVEMLPGGAPPMHFEAEHLSTQSWLVTRSSCALPCCLRQSIWPAPPRTW